MLGNGRLKNKIDSSKDNLSKTDKKSRVKNGISLVVLVITIIVIIIISATVIMSLNKNDGISNSSKAALKTDMQAMLDKQLVTYQEALYSVDGDSSKLDNSAFSDVVPEKYKEEFEATKGGVIYKGENEQVKEIAKEVGIIVVDNKTVAEGIDNLEVETTTNSIQVSVTASNEYGKVESLKYYYSKDNGASWQSKESNRLVETLDKLSQNTGYKIKVEAKSESGNTLTSKEMDVKTKALEIGKIELREEDASGKEYVSGNWTNKGIYIGIVSKNTKSESTTYEVTGANEVTSREESTVINKAGTSKVIVKTTDGTNTESKEYEVKIDNVAPNGSYSKVVGTNDIKVSVQNASDDLSGIEGYSYYIDDILKSTSTTKTYTYTGLNTAEKHIIKVVIKDKAGNEKEIEEQVAAEEVPSAEGNVEYVISPSGATTGNVKVTIKYKQIEGMTGEFSTDGYTYTQVGSTYEYTTNKNMTVYVRYKDSKGQTGVRKEIVIDNIVKSKPLISIEPNGGKYVIPEGKNVAKIKAKVTITDSGDSKIKQDSLEYVWTKSQEAPDSGYSKFTNMQTVEKSDASEGTWYLYIKAENEAGSKTIEKSNGYVIGSASEEDNGIQVLVSPRGYTNKDVTVTIKYGRSLTKELKAGYGDNIQAAIKDANETKSNGFTVGKNGYIYVSGKDEAGNEVTKTVNVNNIDKEAPKIEISTKTATNVKSIDVTIKVSDSGVSGLSPNNVYEYALGKSNKEAPNGVWNKYTSGSSIKIGEGLDGKYYLWVREVADRATNVSEDGEKVGKNNVIGEYEFKNNVEVKFDANGGETPDPSEKYVANGSMYGKLATTKREGYTFSGWYTEKQNGIKIEETTILNNKGDHTLYAHWQANSYTVSFDKNGGETPNPVSKQVRYDDNYGELATTKREYTINYVYNGATGGNTKQSELVKYTFNGWYKDEEHTQKIVSTTKMTTASNHTLYAGWSDGSTTLPTPIKSGYNIEGWYEDQGLTKRVGGAGEKYVPTANVTLYAKYYSSGYIVTFDSNGGDKVTPATKNVEYNFKYGELPTPGKRFTVYFNPNYVGEATKQAISEFTFNGWYLDKNFTNKIDSNSTVSIAANHTLYASWLGGEIRLLDMKRDGYTLDGWYKESNLVTRVGAKDDPYTPTATTTLYAKWTKNNIRVSFNPTGGDKTNPEEKNVKYQESYGELPTTKKEFTVTYEYNGATGGNDRKSDKVSYSFQGWYTGLDYTQIVTSDTIVTRVIDHTLYAKWADNKVAGGLPSPTKSGTKFLGWYADSGFITKVGDAGSDYTPTTNITLYAKWETNGYTVSFDSNGGEKAEPASKVIKAGESYGKLPVVSRAYRVTYNDNYTNGKVKINTLSYTFNGWYTEKQNGTKIEPTSVLTILKDHTLYAMWTTNSIPPEDRTRTGYIFGGWYKESSCINQVLKVGQSYIPASDITLYAKWTPITYEIKYNGNGATSGSMANSLHTYDVAKALTKNAYAKNHTVTFNYNGATGGNTEKTRNKNFSFNSWNSIANGGGNRYTDGQSVVNLASTQGAIVNLYAQWNIPTYGELPKPTRNYTVTYNHNYTGSTDTTAISTYVFEGWFKESGLTNVVNNATQVPANNHTLYAKWTGGSIVLETPVRTGYIFGGWYKEAACTNKVGNAGASFSPTTSDITLYAKWTANTYQIKYNGNGATSGSMTNSNHIYDVAKALTKNAYAKNHTVTFNYNGATGGNTPDSKNINFSFNSWTTQSNGTGNKYTDGESVVNLSSTQGAIVNLYAQWNSNTYGNLPSPTKLYTVTYNHNYTGSTNTTANSTYTFGGWYKENTYANKVESTTQAPMNNHTIYAKWNNGAISGGLETPTRTGYTFGGWYKEAACTNKVGDAGASYIPTSTITLYAKWTANTYQVKYNGNGATSGSMANSNHTYDVASALRKNAYTRNHTVTYNYNGATGGNTNSSKTINFTFKLWTTQANGTGNKYNNGESVVNLASTQGAIVNLYAQWNSNIYGNLPSPTKLYTVTYNHNYTGSSNTTANSTYTFGGWYKENTYANKVESTTQAPMNNHTIYAKWNNGAISGGLETPTRTGYTFGGWYKEAACTNKVGDAGASYTPTSTITLYAKWIANTYQIKYDGNGATSGSMANSTHTYDVAKALTKNAYSKTGYTFVGWNRSNTATTAQYTDAQSVSNLATGGTVTLYAIWKKTVTITYDLNGCTGPIPPPQSSTIYNNQVASINITSIKPTPGTGYKFLGWDKNKYATTATYQSGSTYQFTDSTTLYAISDKDNFILTFDANGGTVSPASISAKYDSTIGPLPTPTRTGYTFTGWYTASNGGTVRNYTKMPAYNETLYAHWDVNTYQIKYDGNGATSGSMSNSTGIKWNSTVSLTKNAYAKNHTVTFNYNGATGGNTPASKNINFSFNSWNNRADGKGTPFVDGAQVRNLTSTNGDTYTIYAQWNSNTYGELPDPTRNYTVTYNHNYTGSTDTTANSTYTFGGWYKENTWVNKIESTTQAPMNDHTIYSKWNNGAISGGLETPTRTGYTFGGWYKEKDCINKAGDAGSDYTPTTNITLYAKWTANTYTVTYNANGGSGSMSADNPKYGSNYVTRSNGFTPPVGHSFKGWNEDRNGNGVDWTGYIGKNWTWTYMNNVTLYAQWKANTYTVTYNANGGDGSMSQDNPIYGENYVAKDCTFTRKGYTFAGWNEQKDGKGKSWIGYTGANGTKWKWNYTYNITLYAQWTPNRYTVTYNANGGSGTMSVDRDIAYGSNYVTKDNGFTAPNGHKFAGWNEKSDGTGISWTSYIGKNWTWTYTNNVTLYAQWEANKYTVKVDPNGGSFNVADTSITKNSDGTATFKTTYNETYYYALGITASRSGYTFDGFYTEKNGGVKVYDGNGVSVNGTYWDASNRWIYTGNVTLYAHWIANSVKVTFMRNSTSTDTTSATQTFTANGTSNCGTFSDKGWSKTGYTLKGWSEDRNATSAYYSTLSGVASSWVIAKAPSITLYGVWKDEEAPTISNKGYSNVGCNSFKVYANFSDSGSGMQKIKWQVREQNNQTILKDSNEISCTSNQKMEYAFSGLKANTTYVINIFAWDKAGNRQYSYTTVTTLEAICERVGDGQQYPSVQNGIDWNTSATLKLLKNHTESAVVDNGKDITFDPGGYTLTGTNRNFSGTMWDIAFTNYGALTLTGSGTISSSGATNSYAIWQSSGKPFKMNGAIISGKTNETLVHIAGGTAEFTGGNIVLEDNTSNNINGNAIFASGTGSFEITTGSVIQGRNGGGSSLVKSSSSSECKITDGYVGKFENTSGSLVYNAGSGKLSISGGKFDMFGLGSGVVNDTGTLNISGGTINLEVKKAGATVWQKGSSAAVANTSSGSVTISGGTINAYSSIGINNYTNGTVELSNVTINNAAPYSGANDIMGATVGATTQKDYTGARGKITIKSGTTIENTNGGIAVYASSYGDVYLNGGYITSNASTWTMYFGHGDRFHPSDAISSTINKYVKNTGGGIEYHFALNQDLKKLYFYANNKKYNILDKEKVGV